MDSIIEYAKRGIRISMRFTILTNLIVIISLYLFNSNGEAEWTYTIVASTYYLLVLPSMLFVLVYELKERKDDKYNFPVIKNEAKLVLWALISSTFILYFLRYSLIVIKIVIMSNEYL